MGTDPIDLAVRVTAILERLDIPCAVVGAIASGLAGEPRATEGVDIVADISSEQLDALAAALEDEFYVPVGIARQAVEEHTSFNIVHLASARKIDIFVAGGDPLNQAELSRRQRMRVGTKGSAGLFVITPEDLILQKLVWFDKGGQVSDRQWRDILGVIKVQADRLDGPYLRRWTPC